MTLQTALSNQMVIDCADVCREASEARESDSVALVGCLALPSDQTFADLQQQADDFRAVADRLDDWHDRAESDQEVGSTEERRHLLDDLRLVLIAIRVAAFDVGLHGRGANMTDTEIADELGKYARLDCQLRAHLLPALKDELGVTDTVAI
ncbi:MAG: hypothetical protein MI757_20265 [Pirellulales bacterium]|nr:hypothetical protein [Pirellulales bacterium]